MKWIIFSLFFAVALAAPATSRAQWIVNDPVNLVQNALTQVHGYTTMATQITMLQRMGGDLASVLKDINAVTQMAQKGIQTARLLQQLDKGNPWAVQGLAQAWGADPHTVRLSGDLANAWSATVKAEKYGISPYTVSAYDRAASALMQNVKSEREQQVRTRAIENASAAEQRAKDAEDIVRATAGSTVTETHLHATNTILSAIASNTADTSKLMAEQLMLEKAKQDAKDLADKNTYSGYTEDIEWGSD